MNVSFSDIDTERGFWSHLTGYCVEIDGTDYLIADTPASGRQLEMIGDVPQLCCYLWADVDAAEADPQTAAAEKDTGDQRRVPIRPDSVVVVY